MSHPDLHEKALDVFVDRLRKWNSELLPMLEEVRTLLNELRSCRARAVNTERRFTITFERLMARVRHEFESDIDTSKLTDLSLALESSLERNQTLRTCAGRYARLVLDRCGGNKRNACRVLGITYHTLQAYLRYPPESKATAVGAIRTGAQQGVDDALNVSTPSEQHSDSDDAG